MPIRERTKRLPWSSGRGSALRRKMDASKAGSKGAYVRGLLVRVGIDSTPQYGNWNAPVDTGTGRFLFIPIRDCPYNDGSYLSGGKRVYADEVLPELQRFGVECCQPDNPRLRLPRRLYSESMHLDPDFVNLTYGDDSRRGKRLAEFGENDFIAFYAGLRPLHGDGLVYALIGLFVLARRPIPATEISHDQRLCNAHTRWSNRNKEDIVIIAEPSQSGIFERCIPIGEWRRRAYRITEDLLAEWGDLSVRNGWLQRSANPPEFKDPSKFRNWLEKQHVRLARAQYQVPLTKPTSFLR